MKDKCKFRRLGTMLDCSRNATMNMTTMKRWIDLTSDMGYNALYLYLEDTYEVDDNPYFGYMRGGYSQKELKEIDDYAFARNMEVIPCIQTLGHLNQIAKWPVYKKHMDMDEILLVGDEAVYELIDKMFASLTKCLRTRTIHIGMDEAGKLGRGKYLDRNGKENPTDILLKHLNRVSEIGRKYDLQMPIWSDMFFSLATGGNYYISNANIDASVAEKIPDNIQLCYWDYYHSYKSFYDKMLAAHEKLQPGCCFAGGLWSWKGFAPNNKFSIESTRAALKSCIEHGIQDVFFTMWSDDGGECSKFATLPSLFYAAEAAKGNFLLADVKKKFKEKFGIDFDRFCALDVIIKNLDYKDQFPFSEVFGDNPEKYLLYNDCFSGMFDLSVGGFENERYKKCARKLSLLKKDDTYGYIFETIAALCDVLSIKAELGVKTREIYKNGDKEALLPLIADYKKVVKKLEHFYRCFRKQWYTEYKGYGFEVQDIRIGGLTMRVKDCATRLQDLYDGKIDCIEELEEELLDYEFEPSGKVTDHSGWRINWADAVTRSYLAIKLHG